MPARCKRRVTALETELTAGLAAEDERTVRRWLAGVATGVTRDRRFGAATKSG